MNTQLLGIQPRELKFMFELKKQSSCVVHLANVTDQYVAFKVKTTSPKKYCVRPNVGIIKPKSTCDFTVTMQAQKTLPPECKDKFLIQSTVVPFGTTEDEITPGMFIKDGQKYLEEVKLRVALLSAPNSPSKLLPDVVLKQEPSHKSSTPKEVHSPVLMPVNGVINQEQSYDTSVPKDQLQNGVENFPPDDMIKKADSIKSGESVEESRSFKFMDDLKSVPAKDEEFYPDKAESKPVNDVDETKLKLTKDEEFYPDKAESKPVKDVDETKLKLTKDIEELRSKISVMESKLVEAEYTIGKLKEEKSNTIREKETLKQELVGELAMLRTKRGPRKTRIGFPPLFVCMVALISLMIGSLFRA